MTQAKERPGGETGHFQEADTTNDTSSGDFAADIENRLSESRARKEHQESKVSDQDTGKPEHQDAADIDPGDAWDRDAYVGQVIADNHLRSRYLFSKAFGWMHFDGRRWIGTDDSIVFEEIRTALIKFHQDQAKGGATTEALKRISGLLSSGRISAVQRVARGRLSVVGDRFDKHPDLLNVGNGVVDLRTGELRPHDPDLLLTKVTTVHYVRGAVHSDWNAALCAVWADAVDWLQIRLGQGITGHPTPDDTMVVNKGSGENGKTTIYDGTRSALGDYAVTLPDRVLLPRNGDHPTELMTLRDARLALMEEFPELGHLNVKRLKDTHGTGTMSARYCGKDSVSWTATHTIMVTTNYLPRVDESDHGTWRRLALIEFPYRYRKPHEALERSTDRKGDPGLRDRLRRGRGGQHEAVLAWLVAGAVKWYANDKVMPQLPESVRLSTERWRGASDLLLRFISEQLVFSDQHHVISTELFYSFTQWLKGSGHREWSDQNFSARLEQHNEFTDHGVARKKTRGGGRGGTLSRSPQGGGPAIVPKQYSAWIGVRFRLHADEVEVSDDQG